jgi:DNA repair exonuclease SbcCD nuclease subunit
MTRPYGLCSDQHLHAWSAFAGVAAGGINTRLQIILDELVRCATEVKAAGGDELVFAGDLFHVRGSIAPEVFNPAFDTIRDRICRDLGMSVIAIPGNHDLAGKETTELGNAMQQLGTIDGFRVLTKTEIVRPMHMGGKPARQGMVIIPWHSSVGALKTEIYRAIDEMYEAGKGSPADYDLIIHAPVNGVIMGIPDHGFDAQELKDFGFKRVFAGHYHDHKELVPGVFSIGATTHQTWSDPGTKAGFLIVHDDHVEYRASHAPSFVDIDATMDPDEMELAVDGNYVRVKIENATSSQVTQLRQELLDMRAAGVVVNVVSTARSTARTTSVSATATTLDQSVTEFVKTQALDNEAAVSANCLNILNKVRAAA